MKKKAMLTSLASLCGVVLLATPRGALAEDWIVPGSECMPFQSSVLDRYLQDVILPQGSIATCPLTKTFGQNNLQKVWVRYQNYDSGTASCNVVATTNLGERWFASTALPAGSGPQFFALNLPTQIQNRGHLSVTCQATGGDLRLNGFRYQQN